MSPAVRLFTSACIAAVAATGLAQGPVVGTPLRGMSPRSESIASIQARSATVEGVRSFDLLEPIRTLTPRGLPSRGGIGGPRYSSGPGFSAMTMADSGALRPDASGDVSPTQIVVAANGRIRVFDRNGTMGALNASTNAFFESVRSGFNTVSPRVRWDRFTKRWYVTMLTTSTVDTRVLLAVSSGPEIKPETDFRFYSFAPTGGSGARFEFPSLAVDANALLIAGEAVGTNSRDSQLFVLRKGPLLEGLPIVVTAFRGLRSLNAGLGEPIAVDDDAPNATVSHVIGNDVANLGNVVYHRITDPSGTPVLQPAARPSLSYLAPGPNFPSLGTTAANPIKAASHRIVTAKICTDVEHKIRTLFFARAGGFRANGTNTHPTDRNGFKWYDFRLSDTGMYQARIGSIYDTAATDPTNYFLPLVAMTGQGHIVTSYCQTSPGTPIGLGYRAYWHGTTASNLTPSVSGVSPLAVDLDAPQPWSNSAEIAVDPSELQTVWTIQPYAGPNGGWGIWVQRLVAPAPPEISTVNPSVLPAGTTLDLVVDGVYSVPRRYFDAGEGFNRARAEISGTGITINSIKVESFLRFRLNVTVASDAPSGTRTVQFWNPDGQAVARAAISVGNRKVSGQLGFADYSGARPDATLQFRRPGTLEVVETVVVNTGSGNSFAFASNLPNGTYDLAIRTGSYLRSVLRNVVITGTGASSLSVAMVNGDANGDNRITTADYAAVNAAIGTTPESDDWNPRLDVNGDLVVNATDVLIVKKNFRKSGAE